MSPSSHAAPQATTADHRHGRPPTLRRVLRALVKSARNPALAFRVLWPRLSPFAAKSPDPQFRSAIRWSFGTLEREHMNAIFPGIEAVDVRIARSFDREPLLSMFPTEVVALAAMVRKLRPRRLLEIGTFEGNTTVNLIANAPSDARMVTVDLPPDWDGVYAQQVPSIHVNAAVGVQIGRQFLDSPYSHRVTQVFEDSGTFDWALDAPYDFILIDGCHTYEYALSDTRNALQVLRPGGVIVWHDYGMLEDVSRLVDEMSRQMVVRAVQGTRIAVGFP